MKLIITSVFLLCLFWGNSQVLEGEKKLKTQRVDSLDGWKKGGAYAINFSQLSLTNWASGGLNSVSLNSFLNCYAFYTRDNFTWDNNLDLGFGMIRQGAADGVWLKSDDKIDFSSKVGFRHSKKLYFAGLFNFRTQFMEGYATEAKVNIISDFFSPAYFVSAIGADIKPGKMISFFGAPITYKSTIVMDENLSNQGAFG